MSERIKRVLCGLKTPVIIIAALVDIIAVMRFLLPTGIVKVMIEYTSWPMLIVIGIVMFREHLSKTLAQVPKFIDRSYYRHGGEEFPPASHDARNIGGKNGGCEENTKTPDDDLKVAPMAKDGCLSLCEPRWIERLQKEYGVQVFVNRSIGVSNYYFDAVMEYQGHLYGIDICGALGHCNLELIFNNVQMAYDGFIPEYKKRFVFMICVTSGNGNECSALRDIAKRYVFPTVVKYGAE